MKTVPVLIAVVLLMFMFNISDAGRCRKEKKKLLKENKMLREEKENCLEEKENCLEEKENCLEENKKLLEAISELKQNFSYGAKSNPGSSCEDIKNAGRNASGIYWITLNAKKEAFPVFCDMNDKGWTMAFKAVSGVDEDAYDTFNNGETSSEGIMAALDTTNRHMNHYKNRIVLNWKEFGASEARVALYQGGNELIELKFDANGSDKLNWFSLSTLTQSPWSDIRTQPQNYFSIRGEPAHKRYFFINSIYGGCPGDAGWMMVAGPLCSWEQHYLPRKNVILYSKLHTYTNWNHYQNVGVADVLVVYVR